MRIRAGVERPDGGHTVSCLDGTLGFALRAAASLCCFSSWALGNICRMLGCFLKPERRAPWHELARVRGSPTRPPPMPGLAAGATLGGIGQ